MLHVEDDELGPGIGDDPAEAGGVELHRIGAEGPSAGRQGVVAPRRLDSVSEAAVKERIEAATGFSANAVNVHPGATSHRRDGVTYRLNKLIEKGPASDHRGKTIGNVADTVSRRAHGGRRCAGEPSPK